MKELSGAEIIKIANTEANRSISEAKPVQINRKYKTKSRTSENYNKRVKDIS
jgi:hypothetical protein